MRATNPESKTVESGDAVLPQLLSKASVCRFLDGVTTRHVDNLVRSGRMPEPVYLGRSRPLWKRSDLMEWIEAGCPVQDPDKLAEWEEMQARSAERRKRRK